ncbi:MAG: hypothetical protein ILA26_07335 [Methanobrevibacter sp.]|uniref:hypothetical protein n=1 Tax=Methanobrevibacter sp. TaxID=66852 RepID=UPI001B5A001E|nr:hypothetical protein [Methanobrevibacter sp.]MBP3791825.1 hypothetical protein [Methanobrevibacter sp.]
MNKKILAIFALLIVVASVSAVSAFDLGDLFGSNDQKNETVTIEGVDFNVPGDFKEDTTNTTDKMLAPFKEQGANITAKGFTKDDSGIVIGVMNVTNGLSNEQTLELLGGKETTINNVTGYLSHDEGQTLFNFEKNDHLVLISASDEKIIGEFVMA